MWRENEIVWPLQKLESWPNVSLFKMTVKDGDTVKDMYVRDGNILPYSLTGSRDDWQKIAARKRANQEMSSELGQRASLN